MIVKIFKKRKGKVEKPDWQKEQDEEVKEIFITEDFQKAFDILEYTDQSLFVHGKAGTGKSTFIKYFEKNSKKKLILLSFTGIAALNIGGQTIHKFFQFPAHLLMNHDIHPVQNRDLYKNIDVLVIDEISMVRSDLMNAIDKFLRINGKDSKSPFGGIQMLFIGDLFQIPPVVNSRRRIYNNQTEKEVLDRNFGGEYFFDAPVFKKKLIEFQFIELKKIFRQSDIEFIEVLNKVRTNNIDNNDLSYLNSRVNSVNADKAITLTTTNKIADQINANKLTSIDSKEHRYYASVIGSFNEPNMSLPAPRELILKKGAQVIFTKNGNKWVNGTIGIVEKLTKSSIIVRAEGETIDVPIVTWEEIKYIYDKKEKEMIKEVIGSFTQFPLKLAWAITIHKSQGQTFENVIIDLGSGAFVTGQTYVAISRCKSLEGISLSRGIRFSDIFIDERVVSFIDRLIESTIDIVKDIKAVKPCPYCQTFIKIESETVVCSECGTTHHLECWEENRGCTTYGCLKNSNLND